MLIQITRVLSMKQPLATLLNQYGPSPIPLMETTWRQVIHGTRDHLARVSPINCATFNNYIFICLGIVTLSIHSTLTNMETSSHQILVIARDLLDKRINLINGFIMHLCVGFMSFGFTWDSWPLLSFPWVYLPSSYQSPHVDGLL